MEASKPTFLLKEKVGIDLFCGIGREDTHRARPSWLEREARGRQKKRESEGLGSPGSRSEVQLRLSQPCQEEFRVNKKNVELTKRVWGKQDELRANKTNSGLTRRIAD